MEDSEWATCGSGRRRAGGATAAGGRRRAQPAQTTEPRSTRHKGPLPFASLSDKRPPAPAEDAR